MISDSVKFARQIIKLETRIKMKPNVKKRLFNGFTENHQTSLITLKFSKHKNKMHVFC